MNNATDSRVPAVFSQLVHDIYAGRQFPDQQMDMDFTSFSLAAVFAVDLQTGDRVILSR